MKKKIFSSAIIFSFLIAALWTISSGGPVGCILFETGDTTSSDEPAADPTTLSFNDLMDQFYDVHSALTSDLSDYIAKDQSLQTIVANSSSDSTTMISAANDYMATAGVLQTSLVSYGSYLTEYDGWLTDAALLGIYKGQAGLPNSLFGSQLGTAIENCAALVATCQAISAEADAVTCLRDINTTCTAGAARIGASAAFGTSVPAITGVALGSAAVTLTQAGAIFSGDVVAGILFDYCDSTTALTATKYQDAFAGTCGIASKQMLLNSAGIGISSLPIGGSGNLSLFIPGCAPISLTSVSVGSSGLNISIACVRTDTGFPEDVNAAINDSGQAAGAVDPATGTCTAIEEVFVNPNPTNPVPLTAITMSVNVFPKATACPVIYSVTGTDGYSLSGEGSTDENGEISFTIDGGDDGVVTIVRVEANVLSTLITYLF